MSTRIVSRWLIINTKYTTLIMSARLKGSRSIDLKITTTQFLNLLLLLLLLFWIGSLLTLRNQIDWQMSNKNWPSLCAPSQWVKNWNFTKKNSWNQFNIFIAIWGYTPCGKIIYYKKNFYVCVKYFSFFLWISLFLKFLVFCASLCACPNSNRFGNWNSSPKLSSGLL